MGKFMFGEWGRIRDLRQRISVLRKEETEHRTISYYAHLHEQGDKKEAVPIGLIQALVSAQVELAELETERLIRKARRRGIELPKEPSWWWEDAEPDGNEVFYLTDIGRAGVARLIREDKRASIEWWVKITVPVLTAIITLLSLVVALVSVSRK